jgi:hypothetical protein
MIRWFRIQSNSAGCGHATQPDLDEVVTDQIAFFHGAIERRGVRGDAGRVDLGIGVCVEVDDAVAAGPKPPRQRSHDRQ